MIDQLRTFLRPLGAFALSFGLGVTGAAASTCAGTDLRPRLEAEAPGSLDRIASMSEANGDAKLWRITSPNGATSHLYGTMHVSDPAIVTLGPEAQQAFDEARAVVIETTDLMDPEAAGASMLSRPDLMFYLDGSDLTDELDDEQERILAEALSSRGMTLDAVRTLRPWVISAQLAVPACALAEGMLDLKLAFDARDSGREVLGLETATEQIEAMTSLPTSFHVASLVDMARMGDAMEDFFATMGILYAEGKVGEIMPMMVVASEVLLEEQSAVDEGAMVEFNEIMIVRRNHTMHERVLPMLAEGELFVAVGALHLPGPDGLVALLRGSGFEVEAVEP